MPFTLSAAQTIAGVANSYEVTGSGNLDELVTACASIGMSRTNNAIVFAPGADRILCVSGTLTDTREGDRTVLIRSQGHICWAYAATSSVTLGLLNATLGVYTGAVHVVYEPTALALGGASQFANPSIYAKCIIGSGTFIGTSGSFFANQSGASHFDYADNLVGVHLDNWRIFTNGTPHTYKSGGRTTTTKNTVFGLLGANMVEAGSAVTSITPMYITATQGIRWLSSPGGVTLRVAQPAYTAVDSYLGAATSKIDVIDPATLYMTGGAAWNNGHAGVKRILRTLRATFRDNLGNAITNATPKLVTVTSGGTATVSNFSGVTGTSEVLQSTRASGATHDLTGVGYTDESAYSFYAVGFGYAAQYLSVNVKTTNGGTAGVLWSPTPARSTLVTTAYASVVTAPFALNTSTNTLTISANATSRQAAEFLFKLAYDNATDAFWRTRNHTPATLATNGRIDFAALNITVTGGTLSGDAFQTTGTVTASGGAVSASYQDATGVRATIAGLDPSSLGTTWALGYITSTNYNARTANTAPNTWTGWAQTSGTGNTTQVTLLASTEYQLFLRIPGYFAPIGPITTIDTASASSVTLSPVVDTDLQGNLLWPQTAEHTTQAGRFAYNASAALVEYTNTTAATDYITFLAAYRALESIAKSPAMAYALIQPLYLSGTKDGFTLPRSNPLLARMSASSTAGAILQADISYADNQAKAFDRFRANTEHAFLLVPQMSATLSSSTVGAIQAGLATKAQLVVVNSGVKKASMLVPHSADLPA
jgi:hypothetical protein